MVTIFLKNLGIALLAIGSVVAMAFTIIFVTNAVERKFGMIASGIATLFLVAVIAAIAITLLGYK